MHPSPPPLRRPSNCKRGIANPLGAAVVVVAVALAGVTLPQAALAALSTETVTMDWTRSGTRPTPPFVGTGSGTFSAVGPVVDAGTLTLVGQDVGVSSPVLAAARTERILTSPDSTLELRCFEKTKDFSSLADIPFTGSCTIVGGTGVYTGLHGHGDFTTAAVDLFTGAVSETLALHAT